MVIIEVFIPHGQSQESPEVFNIGIRSEFTPRPMSTVICSAKTRKRAAEKCNDIAKVLRECHMAVDVRSQPFFDEGGYSMAHLVSYGNCKVKSDYNDKDAST